MGAAKVLRWVLTPLCLLSFIRCGALLGFTEGGPETRHRYHAVFTDSSGWAVVFDQAYSWSCSGSMMRCYDSESDFRFSVLLADLADTLRADTLISGARGRGGSAMYYSVMRKRLILAFQPEGAFEAEWWVYNSLGAPLFEVTDLRRFRDAWVADCVPSPRFDRLSVSARDPSPDPYAPFAVRTMDVRVFQLSLDDGSIQDSLVFRKASADTAGMGPMRLFWEDDSTLMAYSEGGLGYRIRSGAVTDTVPRIGCVGRTTSSSPISGEGRRLVWTDSGSIQVDADVAGCAGYRP